MKTKQKLTLVTAGVAVVLLCLACDRFYGITGPSGFLANKRNGAIVEDIVRHMKKEGSTVSEDRLHGIARTVLDESRRYNIDYRLVLAMMKVESNYRHTAVSPKGARGLLQVKPAFARHMARDVGVVWNGPKTLDEPDKNIRIGVHFFSRLTEDFKDTTMALHAYHVGPTKLRQLLSKKVKLNERFIRLVSAEYSKIVASMPGP